MLIHVWLLKANSTQLDNENKQLKSQLENLKNDNKKEGK